MRRYISIFLILITTIFLSSCSNNKGKEYNSDKQINVNIEIRCDTILNNMDKLKKGIEKVVPKDGIILKSTDIQIADGETVYDLLLKVAKDNKIAVISNGMSSSKYIVGIGGIEEFSCGAMSGWNYKVNGEIVGSSCSSYKLKESDKVQFLYTCNLGKDLE